MSWEDQAKSPQYHCVDSCLIRNNRTLLTRYRRCRPCMRSALFYAPWQELTHTTTPLGDVTEWFSGTMAKPAAPLARSSSLCRSRRSIMQSSPQSQRAQLPAHTPHPSHPRHPHHPPHTQHSLPSPDPDILSVSSCPALYRNEEEEEAIYFSAEKQWYWQ